ncbi:MAG: hypothetical protein J6Q48_06035 [Bacteroidaceae bacterium]|nr:hypothetical protein [Bacteroidaceae bacterium]
MKIHKVIACVFIGHKFDKPSIVNTICRNNWLKECSRCGLYVMHGEFGSVPMTKRGAYKVKREFEEKFPYSKLGKEQT